MILRYFTLHEKKSEFKFRFKFNSFIHAKLEYLRGYKPAKKQDALAAKTMHH